MAREIIVNGEIYLRIRPKIIKNNNIVPPPILDLGFIKILPMMNEYTRDFSHNEDFYRLMMTEKGILMLNQLQHENMTLDVNLYNDLKSINQDFISLVDFLNKAEYINCLLSFDSNTVKSLGLDIKSKYYYLYNYYGLALLKRVYKTSIPFITKEEYLIIDMDVHRYFNFQFLPKNNKDDSRVKTYKKINRQLISNVKRNI